MIGTAATYWPMTRVQLWPAGANRLAQRVASTRVSGTLVLVQYLPCRLTNPRRRSRTTGTTTSTRSPCGWPPTCGPTSPIGSKAGYSRNAIVRPAPKTETAFDTDLPDDYSVRWLLPEDIEAIQKLFENCLDYLLIVDGHGADPNAIEEELFQSTPLGKSPNDRFVFGIFNQQNDLAGLLEGLRQYPDETTWWIGLLLFVPEVRSQGIGQKVMLGFAEYVRSSGGQAIMLGVVEENRRAHKFWNRLGFKLVRKTEPRQFGDKIHTVNVMRWTL
jgi:ribosomal protein S18 acetylase RimI-like enzyme